MNRSTQSILQLLAAELAALGLFVFLIWIIQPPLAASAAAGGLVFILPNTYFTFYALSSVGNRRERWFLTAFFRGHSGKWILTAVGFALAFKFIRPLHSLVMLSIYCVLVLTHLFAVARLCGNLNSSAIEHGANPD